MSYALVLALMVGVIQFIMGLLNWGTIIRFIASPIISGFVSSAAILIGISQVSNLVGLDLPKNEPAFNILLSMFTHWEGLSKLSLLIGIFSGVVIFGGKKFHRLFPGPLVVVVIGILITWWFKLDKSGLEIIGNVPVGLPGIKIPSITAGKISELIIPSISISLLGFVGSVAVAKTLAYKHLSYRINASRELVALGFANILGSFFQSFPATGGFSRSAVNEQAGSKSGLASLISATIVALTLVFLTPLFFYLPKTVLSAIILLAVVGLIDFKEVKQLWSFDKIELAVLLTPFFATLLFGIEIGLIVVGLTSLVFFLLNMLNKERKKANCDIAVANSPDQITLELKFSGFLWYRTIENCLDKAWGKADLNQEESIVNFDFNEIIGLDSTAASELRKIIEIYRLKNWRVNVRLPENNFKSKLLTYGICNRDP